MNVAWILYYISLLPLFFYLAIKYFDLAIFPLLKDCEYSKIVFSQYSFLAILILILVGIAATLFLKHKSKSSFEINGAKVNSTPENINHELIGILSAVVLPFLTVSFCTPREFLASIFMLIVIGLITTRSTIFYKNPVLVLLNLKIYTLTVEHKELKSEVSIDVISFKDIQLADSLYLKRIRASVFLAKKVNNG